MRTFILAHDTARRGAADYCMSAPEGLVVTFKEKTRSLEANAAMWAMLADVAAQVQWQVNGKQQLVSSESWKHIFTASLRKEQKVAIGIDGGFVVLGQSTSNMSKREMSDLLELIQAFGAEHDVRWSAPDA